MSNLNPYAPYFVPADPENREIVRQEQTRRYQNQLDGIRALWAYPVNNGVNHRRGFGFEEAADTSQFTGEAPKKNMAAASALVGLAAQGSKSGTDIITTGMNFRLSKLQMKQDQQQFEQMREFNIANLDFSKEQFQFEKTLKSSAFEFDKQQINRQWSSAAQVGLANPAQFTNMPATQFGVVRGGPSMSRAQLTIGPSVYGI